MAPPAGRTGRRRVALGLSATYFGQLAAAGLFLPFLPLWLEHRGFDAVEIGVLAALPQLCRMALPAIGPLLDRVTRVERAIMALGLAACLAFLLVPLAGGFPATALSLLLVSLLLAPAAPLTDLAALRAQAHHGIPFGRVRVWGSVGYMAANLGGGFAMTAVGRAAVVWVIFAGFAGQFLATLALKPQAAEAVRRIRGGLAAVLRSPDVVLVLLAGVLVQGSHAVLMGFGSILWAARGLDLREIDALWAIAIVGELLVFWSGAALIRRLSAPGLIVIGGLAAFARFGVMALDPPLWSYPLLQLLHGLTFGATYLGTVLFLASRAPPGAAAAMQGVQVALMAASGGLTGIASGWLYGALGAGAFAAMAGLGLAGAALAATLLGRARGAAPG